MKKICILLALIMVLGIMPLNVFAEGLDVGDEIISEPVGEGEVTYPLTIKMYSAADKKFVDKTFNSPDDQLGQWYKDAGRNDWAYNTWKKIFIGWSSDEKFSQPLRFDTIKPGDKIYRDIEPISSVEGLSEKTKLYPILVGVFDLISLQTMLENSGEFNINKNIKAEKIILDTAIEKDEYADGKKLVVSYYDPDKEWYGIQSVSEFSFKDLRIPFLVTENPFGLIKSAKGVNDFTGENPTKYTYEDLVVELDKKMEVATNQTNWTFESSTFIVSDVLDENYNSLSPTIALPNPDSLVTTFSFDNPSKLKKFIIRTTPRNDNSDAKYGSDKNNYPTDNTLIVTGAELLKPMLLKTGDETNIKISRDYAKELLEDKNLESISTGSIKGSMGLDKRRLTANAKKLFDMFLKDDFIKISLVKSANTMNFDFAIPYVRFDKNTNAFGDTGEQNLGYSKFVVNKAMDSDGFNKDTKPNKDINQAGEAFISDEDYKVDETKFVVNGEELTFKGWNTKADGKGKFIEKNTVIELKDLNQKGNDRVPEDLILYAIWEAKEEPKPEPKPEPKDEGQIIFFAKPKSEEKKVEKFNHIAYIEGYEDNTVRANGKLTRAEAAAMVTRLADLDLSNKAKADYKDLEDNAWYLPYINAALKADMLDAEDGNLRPNDNITRAEFAKMLAAIDKDNNYVSEFKDIVGHKYEKEINKITGNKRVEGYEDGTFRPDGYLTRAEAACFLNRMFDRVADDVAIKDFENIIIHFNDLNVGDWYYYEIVEASNTHELFRRGGTDKFDRAYEEWTNVFNTKVR